ncbi:MAG: ammonium transporter, partial [Pseudomonadota bacterium]
ALLATAAEAAATVNKGDTAWMLTATSFVVLMTIPGLALFYGGLVRSKNVLSVLMQVTIIFSIISILWVIYGYSLAFTGNPSAALNPFIGSFSKLFLAGVTPASEIGTFSKETNIPELAFVVFQMTFACITPALIVGAFAERMKFSAVVLFMVLWFTFAYLPMAHMVWFWAGPDAYTLSADNLALVSSIVGEEKAQQLIAALTAATTEEAKAAVLGEYAALVNATNGYLFQLGAIDFAGGTVVHINAGVSALVAAYILGKRRGYPAEPMMPHSLTLTMVGTGLLWVGWFGFNAGSALEAGNFAALAFINTLLATAGAVVAWSLAEWILKGHASMLGAASGAVAGLVAITPAAGNVGLMGALAIGAIAAIVCLWGVTGLKRLLKADDSLDVFGVHGIGGIVGALLTGVFNTQALGGPGLVTDWVTASVGSNPIAVQVLTQAKAVGVTVVWSAVAAFIAFKIADLIVGLRVAEEAEREGLDTNEHNERAYTN